MITNKEGLDVEDEIASHIFVLTRKLKRSKNTKQPNSQIKKNQSTPVVPGTVSRVTRRLRFTLQINPHSTIGLIVDLDTKVNDLAVDICRRLISPQYHLQPNHTGQLWRNGQVLPREMKLKDLPIPIQNDEIITVTW